VPSLSDFWPFIAAFAALVAAGFGAPIPEELPTVGAGVWVTHPEAIETFGPFRWLILPVCFAGVLISDVILYGVGRWWGPRLLQYRWAQRLIPPETWERIERNYDKYGIKVLLMVRWLPAIRSPMFISAGIMRLSFVRFVIADGIALMIGHSLLFFLAWWFGDAFQDLIMRAEERVDRYKPILILIGVAAVTGYLIYHFIRRPVSTGDPQELPLIGGRVAARIEPCDHPPCSEVETPPAPRAEAETPSPPVGERGT
jgi:membrane protein DedA with SNARE-associated domain